ILLLFFPAAALAQAAAPEESALPTEPTSAVAQPDEIRAEPELLEDLVDQVLRLFDLQAAGNTPVHFAVAAGILLAAFVLRGTVVALVFRLLGRAAKRTRFQADDYLLPPLESLLRSLIVVVGIAGALMVLKMPPAAERILRIAYLIAVSLVFLVFF